MVCEINIIDRIAKGLMLLRPCCSDPIVTEAGNYLFVSCEGGADVPEEIKKQLIDCGWRHSEFDGWGTPLTS